MESRQLEWPVLLKIEMHFIYHDVNRHLSHNEFDIS